MKKWLSTVLLAMMVFMLSVCASAEEEIPDYVFEEHAISSVEEPIVASDDGDFVFDDFGDDIPEIMEDVDSEPVFVEETETENAVQEGETSETIYTVTCYLTDVDGNPIKSSRINENTEYVYTTYSYTEASDELVIGAPDEIEGYEFQGWTLNGSSTNKTQIVIPSGSKRDYIYIARYKAIVKISFDSCGGAEIDPLICLEGDKIYYSLPKPTREGYKFCDWYKENGTVVDYTTVVGDCDEVFHAKWIYQTYEVIVFSGEDIELEDITYDIESEDIIFDMNYLNGEIEKERSYYAEDNHSIHVGWYEENDPNEILTDIVIPSGSTGNKYYYPAYEKEKITVNYYANNGTDAKQTEEIEYGDYITLRHNTYSYYGYEFLGWSINKTKIIHLGENDGFLDYEYLNPDETFYPSIYKNGTECNLFAVWAAIPCWVTFEDYDGTYIGSNEVDYGERISYKVYDDEWDEYNEVKPNREGYKFIGWDKKYVDTLGDITVTAQYEKIIRKYYVTYDAKGGSCKLKEKTYHYMSTFSLPTPTKKNCKFLYWYTYNKNGTKRKLTTTTKVRNIGKSKFTVYAAWKNSVVVFFNANGGTVSPKSKRYWCGDKYGSLPAPTRKNYWFRGWHTKKSGGTKVTANSKAPSSKTTLYALWYGPKGTGTTITKTEYNRIKIGMSYSLVKFLIGGPGKLESSYHSSDYDFKSYEWQGNGASYSYAGISFENGKVYSKSQYGLK